MVVARLPAYGMQEVVRSERLSFRRLLPSDADALFELDSDPVVVQYAGDVPLTHIDQARARIENVLQEYRDSGVGRCAAVLRGTNEFIGWAGLKAIKEINGRTDNYDLGYRLLKRHWGKGYGTECARAFIRYGFDGMKLKRISAYADVGHAASISILEKCGMQFTNTFLDEGELCAWYEIVNSPERIALV